MKVECPSCGAAYRIDPDKLPAGEIEAACKECGADFLIEGATGDVRARGETPEAPAGPGGPSPFDGSPILSVSKEEGGRAGDPLALGVVVVALVALVITAFLAFRNFDTGFLSNPIDSVGRMVKNLEEGLREKIEGPKRDVPPHVMRAREAKRYVNRGYNLYRNNKPEKALEEYGRALELDPKNVEAYFWRGRALIKTGQTDRAMADFSVAVKLRPNFADAHDNLGWLYSRRGDYEKGIRHLTRSIELKPKSGWTYYNRGRMYQKTGEMEKALQDAKKACDLGFKDGCEVYEKYKALAEKGS